MLKKILFYFFICSSLKAFESQQQYDKFLLTHKTIYTISSAYRDVWDSFQEKPDLKAIYANLPECKTEYIRVLIINKINNVKILKTIIKEIKDYLLKERMKDISMSYEKAREPEGIYEKNAQGRWVKIE